MNHSNHLRRRYLLTLITLGLFSLSSCNGDDSARSQTSVRADSTSRGSTASSVSDSLTFTMVATDSTSVLDLTRRHHHVESRSTALGAFVTAVDSIENSRSAYWVYSVNDSTPLVAADKQLVAPGDTVRWHLRFSDPTP